MRLGGERPPFPGALAGRGPLSSGNLSSALAPRLPCSLAPNEPPGTPQQQTQQGKSKSQPRGSRVDDTGDCAHSPRPPLRIPSSSAPQTRAAGAACPFQSSSSGRAGSARSSGRGRSGRGRRREGRRRPSGQAWGEGTTAGRALGSESGGAVLRAETGEFPGMRGEAARWASAQHTGAH